MQRNGKRLTAWKQRGNHEQERQGNRHGSNWKTLVILPGFLCLSLAFGLHHIEITQPDHPCQTIQHQNCHAVDMVHAQLIADYNGQGPKAHNITEGVNLNAKAFLVLGPVLLCSGNLAVKHVAEP